MSTAEYSAAGRPIVIAGGGPVGCTLALALSRARVPVVLVEKRAPGGDPAAATATRPIAVAEGSRRILATLGAWQAIAPHAAAIRHIHVSDRGCFGAARLHADEEGVAALGHVVDASVLVTALADAVRTDDGIRAVAPAEVGAVHQSADGIRCELAGEGDESSVDGALLVVADGGRSALRELAGFEAREESYDSAAVTAVVTPRRPHADTAYERFTPDGPMALLPLDDGRCGLVWTRAPDEAARLAACDEATFLADLDACFGGRLGGFRAVAGRNLHPLSRSRVARTVAERIVLVGNAAHVLHPVAGQGLNLGLRDAAWLAEAVARACRRGDDPGARALLDDYAARRRTDQSITGGMTDLLVRTFSNRFAPLVLARNAGLLALDLGRPFKHAFVRQAMGLAGPQPRLARGLPA